MVITYVCSCYFNFTFLSLIWNESLLDECLCSSWIVERVEHQLFSNALFHLPSDDSAPVMWHQDTLGVAKSWDELHNILSQQIQGVVTLVRRSVCLSVAPHVNGYHTIVLTKFHQLMTPWKPKLQKKEKVLKLGVDLAFKMPPSQSSQLAMKQSK